MSSADLTTLYQSLVLEHNRHPRHLGVLPHYTHHAVGANPLCGDQLELWLALSGTQITAIGYTIEASALTRAMTSMMAERVHGDSVADTRTLASEMLNGCRPEGRLDPAKVGNLAAWQGVLAYPNRIKALTLPWASLLAALDGRRQISTEGA